MSRSITALSVVALLAFAPASHGFVAAEGAVPVASRADAADGSRLANDEPAARSGAQRREHAAAGGAAVGL